MCCAKVEIASGITLAFWWTQHRRYSLDPCRKHMVLTFTGAGGEGRQGRVAGTTTSVHLQAARVESSVNTMTCWLSVCSCQCVTRNGLNTLLNSSVCLCLCVCVCVCVCVRDLSSLSGWALCFDFFSSSLRSNASPLSYAARTSLEGLQSLSPSTYKFPPHPPSRHPSSTASSSPSLPPPGCLY